MRDCPLRSIKSEGVASERSPNELSHMHQQQCLRHGQLHHKMINGQRLWLCPPCDLNDSHSNSSGFNAAAN